LAAQPSNPGIKKRTHTTTLRILWMFLATWLRETKYPDFAAIPDPRRG
jgi:hypothetical protein